MEIQLAGFTFKEGMDTDRAIGVMENKIGNMFRHVFENYEMFCDDEKRVAEIGLAMMVATKLKFIDVTDWTRLATYVGILTDVVSIGVSEKVVVNNIRFKTYLSTFINLKVDGIIQSDRITLLAVGFTSVLSQGDYDIVQKYRHIIHEIMSAGGHLSDADQ